MENISDEKVFHIDVISFSAQTVEQALRFCYTDEIPPHLQPKELFELRRFGYEYDIKDLVLSVDAEIINSINVKNAVEIGNLAEELDNSKIQIAANKFILKNLNAVQKITNNFESLSLKNSHMILQLMTT